MRTTFHLTPEERWESRANDAPYAPESLATDGFVHCTDGVEAMVATANRFYGTDPRPFLILTLDLDALDVPWRYDDPGSPFPHIYGPLTAAAILAVTPIPRDDDGRFLTFDA